MSTDFNLEDEYGDLLDILEQHLSEMDDEPLEHFGVKGMKWGVRKERNTEPLTSLGPDTISRKTASGETITLSKVPPNRMTKFLANISEGYRKEYEKQATLNILDGSGKKIGDAMVQKKNNEELYLEWLGIKKSARGKGYATTVMKAGRDFGKQQGFKRMVLEVPHTSLDARHIYEKLGFKFTTEANGGIKDPIWGGLTNMVYEFDDVEHMEIAYFEKPDLNELAELVHYGIKGMRWGHSKERTPEQVDARITKLKRKRDKLDGNKVFEGYHLRGWAANKMHNKRVKKDPGYVKNLSTQDRRNIEKKADAKALRSVILRGSVETAAILVGGNLLMKHVAKDPKILKGGQIAGVILVGKQVVLPRLHQIQTIRELRKADEIRNEIVDLGGTI